MFQKVEIYASPSQTKIIADGKDITTGVKYFKCEQEVGEEVPSIILKYDAIKINFYMCSESNENGEE